MYFLALKKVKVFLRNDITLKMPKNYMDRKKNSEFLFRKTLLCQMFQEKSMMINDGV